MSSSATDTALVDVVLPQLGTSIAEGTIIGWSKSIGDAIEVDETICEISTDKVDSECPSPASGTVAEILVEVGATVDVGTVLARIAVEGAPMAATSTAATDGGPPASVPTPAANGGRRRTVSPVVARIAADRGVDLDRVDGTGRGGRVTKRDLLAYLERSETGEPAERPLHSESPYRPDEPSPAPAAQPQQPDPASQRGVTAQAPAGVVVEPLSRMRRSIGSAMLRSQATTATCHTIVECDMSRVEARRRILGVTALPIVARAVIDTLREYPDLNATLDDDEISRYEAVHLGIAVSLGADGLIVPVIHDAQERSVEGLGSAIKDVARRARGRALQADDVQGATFTITNPGAAGAIIATPIINVPQVAILDVEAIVRRPVVITDADGNEGIAIRPMVNLVLGWDHRAIDGVYAAQFLTALRRRLETL